MEINKIYQGDCLEVLKTFGSKSVDLIITSPPYNLGNTHHTGNTKHNPYDDNMPELEYQSQQIAVLQELHRVLKDEGSLFYNHKNRIKNGESISPYKWLLKTDWIVKQELIWFNRSQNFDKIRFYPMTERVYWMTKLPETVLENNINHHDLFHWSAVGTGEQHKRAFPESLVSDILMCFPRAKVILDPYMGSGTTAKMAKILKRNYIGIEISPEYIKIAEKRISEIPQTLPI